MVDRQWGAPTRLGPRTPLVSAHPEWFERMSEVLRRALVRASRASGISR